MRDLRNTRRIAAAMLPGIVFAILSGASAADESADNPAPGRSGDKAVGRDGPVPRLPQIVVTPTRTEQSSFDLPVSIDVLDRDRIENGQAQVNLSESLARVPGIVAQNRQNYAQDLQISSRGFGARSTFGVRGVRLIADGIPATSPDGQGQAATFDLNTAKRIEVMRGPFSALYGNSSGGVIAVFSEDGPATPTLSVDAEGGSFDTRKYGIKFGGQAGDLNYLAHASRFDTDGFRDHSAATRDQSSAKFGYTLNDRSSITLLASALDQPDTQDPLGLNKAQAEATPRAAGTNAVLFDTRKSIRHDQEGLVYEQRLGAQDSIKLLGYVGDRHVTQFLGLNGSTSLSSGGVVDLDRSFGGTDLRWTRTTMLAGDPFMFTAGVNYDNQLERRQGFINNNGTVGALKRNEDDRVYDLDQYAQAQWEFASNWIATLGVRHSQVRFDSDDHFIVGANRDDSGAVTFRATNPVAGLLYKLNPNTNLYANAGRGFETPTFAELAYRPDGSSGLNFDLKPSVSHNYEVGLKTFLNPLTRLNLALFQIDTENEIVVATNTGGRSTFQNAGRTQRRGAEWLLDSSFGSGFGGYLAFTYVDARYSAAAIQIPGGNRIPGVPRNTAYGELSWKQASTGFETAFELRWIDRIFVNDVNSAAASGYTIANWRAGFDQRWDGWRLREFARIDNLFDRRYIGSVIVNASGGQFYEPAPGRNYLIGLQVSRGF